MQGAKVVDAKSGPIVWFIKADGARRGKASPHLEVGLKGKMLRFSFLASLSQFCEGPSAPAMTLTRKKERVVGLAGGCPNPLILVCSVCY